MLEPLSVLDKIEAVREEETEQLSEALRVWRTMRDQWFARRARENEAQQIQEDVILNALSGTILEQATVERCAMVSARRSEQERWSRQWDAIEAFISACMFAHQ
jgi:hypothetical protein